MKTRVLIQNCATLQYFGASDTWFADSEQALNFENRVRASEFINAEALRDVQIVLLLPSNRRDARFSGEACQSQYFSAGSDCKSLRILHVESSPNWGGQESRTVIEAVWLNGHGFPTWIAADPTSEIYKRAGEQGVPVAPIPMGSSWNPLSIARLFNFVSKHRIDIINTHSSKDSWLCLPLHAAGWPVVRWRNVIVPVPNKGLKRFPYLHACRQIIATASVIREDLWHQTRVPKRKIEVVGEGIDFTQFHPEVPRAPLRLELGIGCQQPLIGMIALMRPEKGHAHFLEAALQVIRSHPQARFVIAGSANRSYGKSRLEMALEARLSGESLEHSSAIHFLGYREDIPNILAALDILVVPSISEARCRVLGEGMAMRKAIIASRVGGMTELIRDDENGLLVPPGKPLALAEAMRSLIVHGSERKRLAEAAYKTALAELSIDSVMKQTISCYYRILRHSPSQAGVASETEEIEPPPLKRLTVAFK